MGRLEPPVGPVSEGLPSDELLAFAQGLREARARAGSPSYRSMAQRVHYSASSLSTAASGRSLPPWSVVEAYLRACKADADQLADWRQRWMEVRRALQADADRSGTSATAVSAVDPGRVHSPEGLADALSELRYASNLSLRALEAKTGYSRSALHEAFSGRRLPSREVLRAIVGVCDPDRVRAWEAAWSRVREEGQPTSPGTPLTELPYEGTEDNDAPQLEPGPRAWWRRAAGRRWLLGLTALVAACLAALALLVLPPSAKLPEAAYHDVYVRLPAVGCEPGAASYYVDFDRLQVKLTHHPTSGDDLNYSCGGLATVGTSRAALVLQPGAHTWAEYLRALDLTPLGNPEASSHLSQGTTIAVLTNDGNLALVNITQVQRTPGSAAAITAKATLFKASKCVPSPDVPVCLDASRG
ncbi:helix-turn-helix domain-containing protein [Streptomyces sp. NPDC003753]